MNTLSKTETATPPSTDTLDSIDALYQKYGRRCTFVTVYKPEDFPTRRNPMQLKVFVGSTLHAKLIELGAIAK